MAVRDIFKISRKTFFNPTEWFHLKSFVGQNTLMIGILKNLYAKPGEAEAGETFEDVMQRQGLNEKDIADCITTYRSLAAVFLLLMLASIFYAGYLVFHHGSLTGCLLSVAVSALFFAQMFKYDFWALQMRRRQLGLTFKDWKRQYLGN